jgi:hypothetical protein
MVGIGCANLIVGTISDNATFTEVMYFLLGCASLALVLSVVVNVIDKVSFNSKLNNYIPLKKSKKDDTETEEGASTQASINAKEAQYDEQRPLLKV